MEECLKKGFMPFIKNYYMLTIFWLDLVSIHYSKKSLEWYEQNGVELNSKEENPTNCLEQRVIESYW